MFFYNPWNYFDIAIVAVCWHGVAMQGFNVGFIRVVRYVYVGTLDACKEWRGKGWWEGGEVARY